MGDTYEPEDIEEFRSGRWSRGEHKMVTPPAQTGPAPSASAPVTTTKAAAPTGPTADLSAGGKHEASSS